TVPSTPRTTRVISRFGRARRHATQVRSGTWRGFTSPSALGRYRGALGFRAYRHDRLFLGQRLAAQLLGGRLGVALDVDAPACQLGRQPCVLALLADGERKLPLRDRHPSGLLF